MKPIQDNSAEGVRYRHLRAAYGQASIRTVDEHEEWRMAIAEVAPSLSSSLHLVPNSSDPPRQTIS